MWFARNVRTPECLYTSDSHAARLKVRLRSIRFFIHIFLHFEISNMSLFVCCFQSDEWSTHCSVDIARMHCAGITRWNIELIIYHHNTNYLQWTQSLAQCFTLSASTSLSTHLFSHCFTAFRIHLSLPPSLLRSYFMHLSAQNRTAARANK